MPLICRPYGACRALGLQQLWIRDRRSLKRDATMTLVHAGGRLANVVVS
jgi:hypothetical protein